MTHVTPTENSDHLDMIDHGNQNDTVIGLGGNDLIAGYDGYDILYGGAGNDKLYGEGSYDDLWGDKGVDQLYGDTAYLDVEGNDANGADYFYFLANDSGDIFYNKADTIHDFEKQDQIWLESKFENNVSIWQDGNNWVVTWSDDSYHDVIVKGDAPTLDDISFF
jgi:Ca2+-binding RTX toxin-like protein